jgi:hypothetical protein
VLAVVKKLERQRSLSECVASTALPSARHGSETRRVGPELSSWPLVWLNILMGGLRLAQHLGHNPVNFSWCALHAVP